MQELDAKKIVWAYMLENGYETNGEWSYYGSGYEPALGYPSKYDAKAMGAKKNALLEKVRTVGVDWKTTAMPEPRTQPLFNGTFNEATNAESLLGTLVLNDGTKYLIGCGDEEARMGWYVVQFAQFAADQERVRKILGE